MSDEANCCPCCPCIEALGWRLGRWLAVPTSEGGDVEVAGGGREVTILMDRVAAAKDIQNRQAELWRDISRSHSGSDSDSSLTQLLAQAVPVNSRPPCLSQHLPPECVICLDEFSADNPKVHTLCQCGENKACFHFPCLLAWLDHRPTCPTCAAVLYYEEGEEGDVAGDVDGVHV